MTRRITEYMKERYDVLNIVFAQDPKMLKIIRHYGPEEIDYANEHIKQEYVARRNSENDRLAA